MSGTLPSTRQQYASILFGLWLRVDVSSSGTTMKIHSMCVLVLLALLVRSTHCFQWDIVVGGNKQLYFYYNDTLTHTQEIPLVNEITSVTYDPVHYRVLFSDVNYPNMSISSFDISTRKITTLLTTKVGPLTFVRVVYDPVTSLLLWKDTYQIYKFLSNPASSNKTVDRNNLDTLVRCYCRDFAVDSCGGYIYWLTDEYIERARLDGSEREVLIDTTGVLQPSLAIDLQSQRMYWIYHVNLHDGIQMSIQSANLYGKNKTTLFITKTTFYASSLAVSKDFVYWQYLGEEGVWQLPKNSLEHVARKLHSTVRLNSFSYQRVAANYKIQDQIQGIKSCEALKDLIPNTSKPDSTVSICQNYCLEGNCSVTAEGQPVCSCKAGYSGNRCEVNMCYDYCLHNGVCYLNEEDKPTCGCPADYEGERCDVAITRVDDCADSSTQKKQVMRDLRSGLRQVLKEELKRILHLFSDKLDEDEASVRV